MTMPIDLVLVRHGESEGNVALRASKAGDHTLYTDEYKERHTAFYRLSKLGRDQARAAGDTLQRIFPGGFDRHYVSDYIRANETAGLMSLPNAQWRVEINLREQEWGDLDNLTIAERDELYPEAVIRRQRHPFHWRPPAGESVADLVMRVKGFLDTLHRECEQQQVLVVCHGRVFWAFRVLIERLTPYLWQKLDNEMHIENCQIDHYTRRDPASQQLLTRVNWCRSIVPWRDEIGEWTPIKRRTFTNEQLLKYVDRYPPIVEAE